jgi:hypothetical protein
VAPSRQLQNIGEVRVALDAIEAMLAARPPAPRAAAPGPPCRCSGSSSAPRRPLDAAACCRERPNCMSDSAGRGLLRL